MTESASPGFRQVGIGKTTAFHWLDVLVRRFF